VRRLLLLVFVTVLNGQTAFESFIDVKVPMRDGIHLSTNVFHPQAPGRYPAILVRTPYGKGTALAPFYRGFVERGYAFVIQDVRGMRGSEGIFRPLDQEGQDGDDTLNWIAAQPWSDGKVGMIGGSYLGIAQWEVAVHGNPHLKAIFPVVSGADAYRDRYYSRGGALKWGHRLLWMSENVRAPGFFKPDLAKWLWHTPERTADRAVAGQTVDWYQNVLDHPQYDRFWRNRSIREKLASIKVPVFAVGGWYDNYAESDLEAFSLLRSLGKTAYIVIGPWGHNMSEKIAGLDFGRDAALNVRQYQLEWFGHWLKGSALPPYPPARLFVTGENAWHGEDDWPPSDVRTLNVFLSTKGRANTAAGNGGFSTTPGRKQRSDLFTYDPKKPVPTRGGSICCNAAVFPSGPLDQRPIEQRRDVLVYTGRPLKQPLEIAGTVQVQLWVSTSAPDTDFTAKLVDVEPDGTARLVTDGILRLRYRGGLDHAEFARPRETYAITIDAGVSAHVFRAKHRVRLEISSSNFPRFDRNPNTGRPVANETEYRTAQQTVYSGGRTASALLLPVVPGK